MDDKGDMFEHQILALQYRLKFYEIIEYFLSFLLLNPYRMLHFQLQDY
jgi:hypothetical protein